MHSPITISRHSSKPGLLGTGLEHLVMDSSLDINTYQKVLEESPSESVPPSAHSFNGTVATTLLVTTPAGHHLTTKSPSGSLSRAYSATLSKLSSGKFGLPPSKLGVGSTRSTSKASSSGGSRLFRRPKIPDFDPPHCEKRVFDDGHIVHMIGSATPPIIKMEDFIRRMTSFPSPERNTPLLDVEFSLDETSFGFNKSATVSALHIQVRSPSIEIHETRITTPVNVSLQTIYHSMDSFALSANPPTNVGTNYASPFLSPFESTSQVDVNPRPSPRLSASLMPQLTPIILSDLAAIPDPEPESNENVLTTPVTPLFSPACPSDPGSELPSPTVTSISSPRYRDTDDAVSDIFTSADYTFNPGVEDVDARTILDFELELANATFPSITSSNRSRIIGKERRWDSLYPSPSEVAALDALDQEKTVSSGQQQSVSSSSVLAPLTQADFDATFEEVFRVGFPGSYVIQGENQTTSNRAISINPQA